MSFRLLGTALLLVLCACSVEVELQTYDASADGAPFDAASDGLPFDGGRRDASRRDAGDGSLDAGPCDDDMALMELEAGRVCIDLYEGAIVVASEGDRAWPYYEPL